MALPKLYEQITWVNDTTPALNEDNLNAMSQALDDIDDRVIDLAGTIMEDVPQIIEDMEILSPAVEDIDENVARAEAAAESAEQYAEEIAPPIEVVKDFAPIITIADAINKPVKDLKVKVDPVQDLHGYTKPWVGGAGKNKLPNNLTSSGIITVNDDGSIKINGTTTSEDERNIFDGTLLSGPGSYIASANFPSYDSAMYMGIRITNASSQNRYLGVRTSDVAIELASGEYISRVYIHIDANKTVNNVTIYPMIRLASVADGTYERYSNICPITGWTGANVLRSGTNLLPDIENCANFEVRSGLTYTEKADNTLVFANSQNIVRMALKSVKTYPVGEYKLVTKSALSADIWVGLMATNDFSEPDSISLGRLVPGSTSYTFTITEAQRITYPYMYIQMNIPASASDYEVALMIVTSDTADLTYKPYTGTTYVISFGGTYYLAESDVTSGVLTVLGIYADLSTFTWTLGPSAGRWTTNDIQPLVKMPANNQTAVSGMISDSYENLSNDALISATSGMAVSMYGEFRVKNGSTTTEPTGHIVYPLATPQTITLTPTEVELLWQYNTLFADTGDLSLTYDASGIVRIAEAKLDIDVFKEIVAASSDFSDFKSRVAAL